MQAHLNSPPSRRRIPLHRPDATHASPAFVPLSAAHLPASDLDRLRLIRRLLRLTYGSGPRSANVLRGRDPDLRAFPLGYLSWKSSSPPSKLESSVPFQINPVRFFFSVGLDRFHHALGRMAFVDADKLSYEIFSVLESKFLFGLDDPNKLFFPTSSYSSAGASPRTAAGARGRIRILSIDGGGSPSDALLAAVALARLESSLRHRSGDPSARVAYMFDVAAGSGAGGVLVAMLFTRDHDGRPLFSATDALHLLLSESRRRGRGFSSGRGLFRGMFRRPGSFFRRIFGDATLRDTVKPVLIPCYDLATGAPFLFSRADAVEADGYDFRMWEVCAATCADASTAAVDLRSVDGRTRVTAVGAGVAMANPVAAAITHVLHNKPEFPFAAGVEDLMVVSLGASAPAPAAPGAAELVRIAGEGFADMVRIPDSPISFLPPAAFSFFSSFFETFSSPNQLSVENVS